MERALKTSSGHFSLEPLFLEDMGGVKRRPIARPEDTRGNLGPFSEFRTLSEISPLVFSLCL